MFINFCFRYKIMTRIFFLGGGGGWLVIRMWLTDVYTQPDSAMCEMQDILIIWSCPFRYYEPLLISFKGPLPQLFTQEPIFPLVKLHIIMLLHHGISSCLILFHSSLLTENPWPQHMCEMTGLRVMQLLDCTLHLHQQWYEGALLSFLWKIAFNVLNIFSYRLNPRTSHWGHSYRSWNSSSHLRWIHNISNC